MDTNTLTPGGPEIRRGFPADQPEIVRETRLHEIQATVEACRYRFDPAQVDEAVKDGWVTLTTYLPDVGP